MNETTTQNADEMEKHVSLLAAFYLALSLTGLLTAAIVYAAIVGGGLLSGDEQAIFITSTVGTAVSALVTVLSVPGLFAAYGLFKRRYWGRHLAIVVGAMNVINVPVGTALAVYTFWVLTQDDAIRLFE
jgi:hypothetical protein